MVNVLFLGGLLNIVDPIFGLQLYIWGWVGLTVLAIFAYLGWYFAGWKPYAPLHGLYYAWKAGSNAALIFDANLIGEMVSERVAKCIFDYSKEKYEFEGLNPVFAWFYSKIFYYPTAYLSNIDPLSAIVFRFGKVNKDVEIARHLQGGEWERAPSVVCGGVPVDIVVDTDNWTIRNSPQHKAIENCARLWNEANTTDQIHSYSKFSRYLNAGKIQCPDVRKNATVSWVRIDTGYPLDLEESDWAGKRRQMAEQEYNADQISKNKMALWVLFGGLGLSALIVVARILMHFF